MQNRLRSIRAQYKKEIALPRKVLHVALIIALGAGMGYFAENLEYYSLSMGSPIIEGLANIGDCFSVWIFTASLIAYLSRSPVAAACHTFTFFISMNAAYFIGKGSHYSFSVNGQFLFWTAIALLSTAAAIMLWYSRVGGKFGTLIKLTPELLIIAEGILIAVTLIRRSTGGTYYPLLPENMILFFFYVLAIAILSMVFFRRPKT